MSTTTAPVPPQPASARPRTVAPTTQIARVASAEWTKLRSVRSTVWSLLGTVLVCVGLPALIALAIVSDPHGPGPDFQAASFSLLGVFLGQLVIGSLGVLLVSAEYSTGTIRASLSAVPQRWTLLVAKVLTTVVVLFVVSIVTCFAAFFATQSILDTKDYGVTLSHPGSMQVVVGGALYLTVVGLLGMGLAFMLRHTAAAIATVFGLLFVLPILANFLPASWQEHIVKYLPGQAGQAIFATEPQQHTMAPWTGLGLFAAYAVVSLLVGGWLLQRRDA